MEDFCPKAGFYRGVVACTRREAAVQQSTIHNPQPTTHNPQPTTHNPQPTIQLHLIFDQNQH
jgi:hypothetical protein